MKRKRLLLVGGTSVMFIAAALFILRFYVLDRIISSKLDDLYRKTGIRTVYEDLDVSFKGAVIGNISFYWEKETAPFAQTDAAAFTWSKRVVKIDELRISRRGVKAAARGSFQPFHNFLDVEISMPPSSCADFLQAIPEKFRERMNGVALQGKLAFDFHIRIDEDHPKRDFLNGDLRNGCRIENFGSLPTPDKFRKPFSHQVYDPRKKPFKMVTGPGTDPWVDFSGIHRYVIESVLEAEDPLFYQHNGILLSRIETAARINLARNTLRYGASTITMQTAKNLFLTREKTFARKVQEVFFVWYLESNFTKDEILTLYLNLAEFGPSLYGIKDAAAYYFGRAPSDLNLRQSAFLAKLLPRPVERAEAKELGQVPDDLARRIRALLADMKQSKRITKEEYDEALSEKIRFDKQDIPGRAAPPSTAIPPTSAPPLAQQPIVPQDVLVKGVAMPSTVMPDTRSHVTRISRPRLMNPLLPPLSEIISDRNTHGIDLGREPK